MCWRDQRTPNSCTRTANIGKLFADVCIKGGENRQNNCLSNMQNRSTVSICILYLQLATALAFAFAFYRHGTAHRDLKPENVRDFGSK